MGIAISRFRRKKSTTEVLEGLEYKINNIERNEEDTERKRRTILGYVMAVSVALYITFAVLYYFMYIGRSQHWLHSVLYASPLLVLPIIVIFLRSSISWYYNWSLETNRKKLISLRNEKKKILEDVKNTETYKVASEILEKFGGLQDKMRKPFVPSINVPGNEPRTPPTPVYTTPGQIRQRQLSQSTPVSANRITTMDLSPRSPMMMYKGPRLNSNHLPRPLIKSSIGLDKLMDFIIKDGPSYRMALICKECCSHNGMAMTEEFDYISYICAYCGTSNPARKAKPIAPPLTPLPAIMNRECDSPSPSSASESEDEQHELRKSGSENEVDRSPSPSEKGTKSSAEKKKD